PALARLVHRRAHRRRLRLACLCRLRPCPPGLRPRPGRARRAPRRLRHAHERRLHQRSRRVWIGPAVAALARRRRALHGRRHGSRLRRASSARAAVMIGYAAAFGAGFLFGIGLWISGMATPRKVLDFLDVAGSWDPSLALVMAGAVGVTLALFGRILKRPSPFFADRFTLSLKRQVDRPLIVGATVFGIGWG